MVTFTDFFTDPCCDFVNVYDGSDGTAPLLAKLSGSRSVPIVYYTTQSDMFVAFNSDSTLNNVGYAATFVSTAGKVTKKSASCHDMRAVFFYRSNNSVIFFPKNHLE